MPDNNDLESKFLAQTASKRLIQLVVGGVAAFFAVGFFAHGAFSFFLFGPLVLIGLLYSWFQHRQLLSKASIVSAIVFLLVSCWGIIGLLNTGQVIPASTAVPKKELSPIQPSQQASTAIPAPRPKPTSTPRPRYTPTPDFRDYGRNINQPMPIGLPIGFIDGTTVFVESVTENANQIIRRHDAWTEPPPSGHQFLLVEVKVSNQGDQPIDIYMVNGLSLVGKSKVSYDQGSDCWTFPNEIDTSRTIFPEGSLTGNICFTVKSSDVDGLVMYYETFNILGDNEFVYWALE